MLAFPLLDVFRMSSERRAVYGFESRGVIENLAVKDYDQMVMIANGLWYVDDRGHHFGMQMYWQSALLGTEGDLARQADRYGNRDWNGDGG